MATIFYFKNDQVNELTLKKEYLVFNDTITHTQMIGLNGLGVLDAMTTIFYFSNDQVIELTLKEEYLVLNDTITHTSIGLSGL